jgi:hypothetical protein
VAVSAAATARSDVIDVVAATVRPAVVPAAVVEPPEAVVMVAPEAAAAGPGDATIAARARHLHQANNPQGRQNTSNHCRSSFPSFIEA